MSLNSILKTMGSHPSIQSRSNAWVCNVKKQLIPKQEVDRWENGAKDLSCSLCQVRDGMAENKDMSSQLKGGN